MANYANPYVNPNPRTDPNRPDFDPFLGGPDELRWYLNANPDAGFYRFLQNLGISGGTSPVERYAQNRYQTYWGNYQAQAQENPDMGFYDYLEDLDRRGINPDSEYKALMPNQRNDYGSRSHAARGRWINVG